MFEIVLFEGLREIDRFREGGEREGGRERKREWGWIGWERCEERE